MTVGDQNISSKQTGEYTFWDAKLAIELRIILGRAFSLSNKTSFLSVFKNKLNKNMSKHLVIM